MRPSYMWRLCVSPVGLALEFRYVGSVEGGEVFEQMSLMELTQVLQDLADQVNLTAFVRHPRAQKETKSRLKRRRPAKRPHVSTAKILSQNKAKKQTP